MIVPISASSDLSITIVDGRIRFSAGIAFSACCFLHLHTSSDELNITLS